MSTVREFIDAALAVPFLVWIGIVGIGLLVGVAYAAVTAPLTTPEQRERIAEAHRELRGSRGMPIKNAATRSLPRVRVPRRAAPAGAPRALRRGPRPTARMELPTHTWPDVEARPDSAPCGAAALVEIADRHPVGRLHNNRSITMSIEDRLDREPAPGWRPEPGGQVVGKIVEISEAPGTDYGPYPLLTIEKDDGTEVAVHAFHSVLKNEIDSKRPTEGDRIGIRYLGKKTGTNGGRDYEAYRVVIERATPAQAGGPSTSASTPSPAPAAASSASSWDDEDPF